MAYIPGKCIVRVYSSRVAYEDVVMTILVGFEECPMNILLSEVCHHAKNKKSCSDYVLYAESTKTSPVPWDTKLFDIDYSWEPYKSTSPRPDNAPAAVDTAAYQRTWNVIMVPKSVAKKYKKDFCPRQKEPSITMTIMSTGELNGAENRHNNSGVPITSM